MTGNIGAKTPLLVGLIAQFTDTALQEDIVAYARRLIARRRDILDRPSRRLAKRDTGMIQKIILGQERLRLVPEVLSCALFCQPKGRIRLDFGGGLWEISFV